MNIIMQQFAPLSSKNELQEYMQKRKLALPTYETMRHGGTDHEPLWISQVTLHDGSKCIGVQSFTKKLAECSAASKVLNNFLLPSEDEKRRCIEILNSPPDEVMQSLLMSYRNMKGYEALTKERVKNAVTVFLITGYIKDPKFYDAMLIINNGWINHALTDTASRDEVLNIIDSI
jgi:hypothetical protein